MSASTLETVHVSKVFPGTRALDDVSLRFDGGKIHALIGKNGAGKSTLVKIIAGALGPTSGAILVNGTPVRLRSPRDALREGIAAVYQELSVIPELTVGENILLGRLPHRVGLRRVEIDWERTYREAGETLHRLGVDLDLRAKVRTLNVARRQFVEIAKAMSYKPSVLLLDEPTSALSPQETERLFQVLRGLAAQGVVLLYITHRLQEIERIADTVTALRNGTLVGTVAVRDASPEVVARMMFGEVVRRSRSVDLPLSPLPALQVEGFSRGGKFSDISFTLQQGEILGLAGLLGSGRSELLRALFGADPPDGGVVLMDGIPVRPSAPAQMKRLGVVLAPEDRKEEGLIQLLSTRINLCLANLAGISFHGFISRLREQDLVDTAVRGLGIMVADPEAPVASLSGGNQQKVVLGKWLATQPRVLLLDEPTRGIDLQAKQQMFEIIWDLSRRGIACIVVSSELEELLDLCHRIIILRRGRVAGEVRPHDTSLEQLVALCFD